MPAPRRPNITVLVPDSRFVRHNNSALKEELNEPRREGVVEGDGVWRKQVQKMKENIKAASSTGRTLSSPISLEAPPTPQAATTYTVSIPATTYAASIPERGAEVEIGTLAVQDRNKPNIAEPKLEAQTLPGVNQDTSNMGEVPKSSFSSVAENSERPSAAPAITVNKPLPGQNQVNPIVDELSPPMLLSLPTISSPPTPSYVSPAAPPIHCTTSTSTSSSEATVVLVQSMATSNVIVKPTISTLTSPVASFSSLTSLLIASFVTITQSEQGNEASPVTLARSSSVAKSITSTSASPAYNTEPQAIVVAQSFAGIFTSTTTIAATTIIPATVTNDQDGSILHPTTRTLLILFVILGGHILVAFITCF